MNCWYYYLIVPSWKLYGLFSVNSHAYRSSRRKWSVFCLSKHTLISINKHTLISIIQFFNEYKRLWAVIGIRNIFQASWNEKIYFHDKGLRFLYHRTVFIFERPDKGIIIYFICIKNQHEKLHWTSSRSTSSKQSAYLILYVWYIWPLELW